ncbi:hypothetical protein K502DRAFT_325050 [Neoconidiobolus thromboides FSU 785]|nr:hypothetical protein K502DRAFT_325050 [Neoconidiobolus thromboides FSU 785]
MVNNVIISNAEIHLNLDKYYNVLSLSSIPFDTYNINKLTTNEIQQYLSNSTKITSVLTDFFNFVNYPMNSMNLININKLQLNNELKDIELNITYFIDNNNRLKLAYEFDIDLIHDWYHVYISINNNNNNDLLCLINYTNKASYNVYPLGTIDPNQGSRQLLINPYNKIASPLGWHNEGNNKTYTTTKGNNVYAINGNLKDIQDITVVEGGNELNFNYSLSLLKEPETYINASITNLFYICNILHDLYYLYGFNEINGNFQNNNFDLGGKQNDGLLAYAQSNNDKDNADFTTPPDGKAPRMRMYLWDETIPNRDGDLEQDIIIHEYTHGLSIRLTGGPSNSNCLGWGEAGGMGEGWGDIIAIMLSMNQNSDKKDTYFMGYYANGNKSIRKYPYSTNITINPSTYEIMDKSNYWSVHAKGEVWAMMVLEVYWNLIEYYKFNIDWFDIKNSLNYGNTLMLKIIIDALKLQPCRPTFVEARDAILLAASNLKYNDKKLQCLIWKGFAKRGLGVDARLIGAAPWGGGQRKQDFNIPSYCNSILL